MIDLGFKDKVVLITGANHGIGAAAAKAFALQGAKVCISYYRAPSKYTKAELEKALKKNEGSEVLYEANQQKTPSYLLEEIKKNGGSAIAIEKDLSIVSNINELFDFCENGLGPVDILINNHTYYASDTFDDSSEAEEDFISADLISAENIDKHFDINVRAYALMMKEYAKKYMKRNAKQGRIINISTDGAHANEFEASYAASKHAIESYSRSAALGLGKYGITVNIASIGPVNTGFLSPNDEKFIAQKTPLKRVGRPEDIADALILLASQQANWITGQLIYIGGGWRMHQ
ncbi:MAG: SDR family oxidoreductase [Desulfobacter sp.]|nr:MAG: SDR family oxidoreductase [Desulfobacter sp.]